MLTKEDKLKRNEREGKALLRLPVLMELAEHAIRFLLSAVLAGAELAGGFAMGGVAMVGASGAGAGGLAALLGACFGYLCFRGSAGGLRYIAASVLVFSVSFAFGDSPLLRRSWFMPAAAAALNGLVGFIYLSEGGWSTGRVIFFFTEVALTGALAYLYRLAFSVWEEARDEPGLTVRQTVGLLSLVCSALMTLSRMTFLGQLSLGRTLAALLVMLAGWRFGVGAGSAVGVSAGLSMDLAAGTPPYYAAVFAFSGLMAGVFRRQGRLFTASAYVVADAAAVLWTWERGAQGGLLYEVFMASVAFLVLPDALVRRLESLSRPTGVENGAERARAYAARRLSGTASAFRELSALLRESFQSAVRPSPDAGKIFTRAADRVCARCALRELCWSREYQTTRSALNDTLPALLDRGRGEPGDYPPQFALRCVSMAAFSSAVNEELAAHLTRRQCQSRVQESRSAVCQQYGQLAAVLEQASEELSQELAVDTLRQRRVKQRMAALGLEGETAVFFDEHGRLRVEVAGARVEAMAAPEEVKTLSGILGVPLRAVEDGEPGRLVLSECEPLMAVAGVAARQKEGQSVSGDAGAWFKDDAGRLHIFLCDGMGSGAEAHADSSGAIGLLEKFLRAGVEPTQALITLNGALALRGEEQGGFTTIDLLRLDLFTGKGALYKFGAAPSYLRQGGQVRRLAGQSLPAGVDAGCGVRPDVLALEVRAGDWLVMASDGVTGGEEDWIAEALDAWEGDSPRLLAQQLLEGCTHRPAGQDDKTVVALKLILRPEPERTEEAAEERA